MATKHDLVDWVKNAVDAAGGSLRLVDVARHIWDHHEGELRNSGDLFFTWQYDMRWAAQELRDRGIFSNAADKRGVWRLTGVP